MAVRDPVLHINAQSGHEGSTKERKGQCRAHLRAQGEVKQGEQLQRDMAAAEEARQKAAAATVAAQEELRKRQGQLADALTELDRLQTEFLPLRRCASCSLPS